MTKAMAVEWAREGIRVNAVAPTFVETPMTATDAGRPDFREEVLERRLPTGALAQIEDVARAVRYLACEASYERHRTHPRGGRWLDRVVSWASSGRMTAWLTVR